MEMVLVVMLFYVTGAKTGSGSDGNIKIQKSDGADLLTITNGGVMTLADGTHDFDVASHDGTNGLKLGGALVTSTAVELNYLDISTLGTSEASKAVTAGADGVVKLALSSSDTNADRVGFNCLTRQVVHLRQALVLVYHLRSKMLVVLRNKVV